jgi:SAM-dependent methyltransferase
VSAALAGARLAAWYDDRLAEHGDTPQGAAWPNARDRATRYDVMLELAEWIAPPGEIALCDLGCGTGELLARIRARGLSRIRYAGADVSAEAIAHARRKFPDVPFHRMDVLGAAAQELEALHCDVLVANGLFTVKASLTHAEMWDFMTATVARVWPLVRRGIAFNVMSAVVDRERDDLFHVPYDAMARFLHGLAGRAIGFRADYGLYEYTAYALKTPARG